MQDLEEHTDANPGKSRRGWSPSLSGKVLALAAIFVMIGEVLIFLPSIANFRVTWLNNRIATAEVAALAVEAAQERAISSSLREELLKGAGVTVLALRRNDTRQLVLIPDRPPVIEANFDLRSTTPATSIMHALETFMYRGDRTIGIIGIPPNMSGTLIELALNEKPLFDAMVRYSINILTLSIILSLIVAALLFVALNRLLVRPVRRLSKNMLDFSGNPEDHSRIIEPSGRQDEIGMAERELAHMQTELAGMLSQKSRLAALGLAVSKVSHDLRNMLTSAQLISDRLGMVDDPTVRKFTPKLIASLDRAIAFCEDTLKFGRANERPPRRSMSDLRDLVDEAIDYSVTESTSRIVFYNEVSADLKVDADREQLFRIMMNLLRNAADALEQAARLDQMNRREGEVRVSATRDASRCVIEVRDNGPGVPEKAKQHLFEAFRGSQRQGGTGLGLAIASELVRAHGGEIRLVDSSGDGATFQIVIPDRVKPAETGRRGARPA